MPSYLGEFRQQRADWPRNMDPKDRRRFEAAVSYVSFRPGIREIEDAFIAYNGLVMTRWRLEPTSVVCERSRQFKYLRSLWLNRLLRKSINFGRDEPVAIAHGYYCPGYFHWLTDALPRLLALGEHIRALTVLIPACWPAYARSSIEWFGPRRIVELPRRHNARAARLVLPEHHPEGEDFDPEVYAQLRALIWSRVLADSGHSAGKERLYISRRKAAWRKIANERDLFPILESLGYRIVDTEDLTLVDQVRLFAAARSVVSLHGAGLSNMMWMPPGSDVIEIIREPATETQIRCYLRLAWACGHRYRYLTGPGSGRNVEFNVDSVFVDPKKFESTLAAAEG